MVFSKKYFIIIGVPLEIIFITNEIYVNYNQYEYIDQNTGTAQLAVTCVIHNTGDTAINEGCVTLKAQTDKREYLQTITVSMKIIPDGKIAVNAIFAYLENTERLKAGGVTIYADYFN